VRLAISGLVFSAGLLAGATQASAAPLLQLDILSRYSNSQSDGVSSLLNGFDYIGAALSERPTSRLPTEEFSSNGNDSLLAFVAGSTRSGGDIGALGTWVSELSLLNSSERSTFVLPSAVRGFSSEGYTPHFDLYEAYLRLCSSRGCDSLLQRDLDRSPFQGSGDNGSIPPIPEPATLVLLATGLAISARSLRRRRPANK
jgi:hypothetical protein